MSPEPSVIQRTKINISKTPDKMPFGRSAPKIPEDRLEEKNLIDKKQSKISIYENLILELFSNKNEIAKKEFTKKLSKLKEHETIEFTSVAKEFLKKSNTDEKIILMQGLAKARTFAFVPIIIDICNSKNKEERKIARQCLVKLAKSKIALKRCSEFEIKYLQKELEEKIQKSTFKEKSAILKFIVNSEKIELFSILMKSSKSKFKMERECALKYAMKNFALFDYFQKSSISKTIENEIINRNKRIEFIFAKMAESLPLQNFENSINYILTNGEKKAKKIITNVLSKKSSDMKKLDFNERVILEKIINQMSIRKKIALKSSIAIDKLTKVIDNKHLHLQSENSKTRIGINFAVLAAFGLTVFPNNLNNFNEKAIAVEKDKKESVNEEFPKERNINNFKNEKNKEHIQKNNNKKLFLNEYSYENLNLGIGENYEYKIDLMEETINSNGVARLPEFKIKHLEKINLLKLDNELEQNIFDNLSNKEKFKKMILKQYNIDFSRQLIGSTEIKINNEKVSIELNTKGFLIKTKSGKFISSMSELHSTDLLKSLDVPNKNLNLQQFRFEDDIQAEKWTEKNYSKLIDFYKDRIQISSHDFKDNIGNICLITTKANMGDDVLYSFLLISEKGIVSSQTVSYKEITGEVTTENHVFYEPKEFGIKTMLTKKDNSLELLIMPYRTKHLGLVKKIKIPMQSEKI